jgi:hypothetical protein
MAFLLAEDHGVPTEPPPTVDEDGYDYDDADFLRAAGYDVRYPA